jgi:hypothetical protein
MAFKQALKEKIDGRRARYMRTKWYPFSDQEKVSGHVFSKKYDYASFTILEKNAADCLALSDHLHALIDLAKIKQKKVVTPSIFEELINYDLINKMNSGVGYEITPLGKRLLKGNHWMTIWVTNLLINKGIQKNSIIWHVTEGPDEVDLAVGFRNNVWIFELKGADFESGHAHPFVARKARFKPDKTIIITTGKIRKDAKKVFEDIQTSKFDHPLYIEGLNNADEVLSKLVDNTILESILTKCEELSKLMCVDLKPIFTKIYGQYSREYKGEYLRKRD